jgi:hypothetical protein
MARKTKRDKVKYKNLDKSVNLKTRQDLIDYDYLHKLNKKELEWLDKFTGEWICASLDNENPRRNLHKTKKLRKDCYDRNNARNRDILTRSNATKRTKSLEDIKKNTVEVEEGLNNKIDMELLGIVDKNGKRIRKKRLAKL